ncbi:hypothetical protein ACU8MI_06900 [Rhizobium leguminosarum]
MQKWDVVRIYCPFLTNPHDKYCICICPVTSRFFFINSDPPQFRKARQVVISIESYEAHFLNHTSYVDTTNLLTIEPALAQGAWAQEDRRCGSIAPFLQDRIKEGANSHNVLHADDLALVLS